MKSNISSYKMSVQALVWELCLMEEDSGLSSQEAQVHI